MNVTECDIGGEGQFNIFNEQKLFYSWISRNTTKVLTFIDIVGEGCMLKLNIL